MGERFFTVKDFDRLQYRSDKALPWVKLHCGLLDDPAFERLPDSVKWHYCGLLLLARRSDRFDHSLPWEPTYLQRKLALSEAIDLQLLSREGFISLVKKQRKPKKTKDEPGAQDADGERPNGVPEGDGEGDRDRDLPQLKGLRKANTTVANAAKDAAFATDVCSRQIPEEVFEEALSRVRRKNGGDPDYSDIDWNVACRCFELGFSKKETGDFLEIHSFHADAKSPSAGRKYIEHTIDNAFDHVALQGNIGKWAARQSG